MPSSLFRMRIGIIGLGTVGKAIRNGLESSHKVFFHDKNLGTDIRDVTDNTDLAYIAVPTPGKEVSGDCDTSMVEEVLNELPEGFSAVIKSTVIPGTTQRLQESFPHLKIGCSPEFLRTATSNEDFQNQDILIVGTKHKELAERIFTHHIEAGIISIGDCFHVSPTQAELVKYAKNSFYAMKVVFANQFFDYCEDLGEDWDAVREIITRPRMQQIGDSHLDANIGERRGFGGVCLPKDTAALYADLERRGLNYNLLAAILEDNKRLREINIDIQEA